MRRTREEDNLLEKLRMRYLDGMVGDRITMSGGAQVWFEIRDGIPAKYMQWGVRYYGKTQDEKPYIAEKWETATEKLAFLQKYGFLMTNPDVRVYSAKYKPVKTR